MWLCARGLDNYFNGRSTSCLTSADGKGYVFGTMGELEVPEYAKYKQIEELPKI